MGGDFFFSFLYVHNDRGDRKKLWDSMVSISSSINGAWVVLGDFNAIASMD